MWSPRLHLLGPTGETLWGVPYHPNTFFFCNPPPSAHCLAPRFKTACWHIPSGTLSTHALPVLPAQAPIFFYISPPLLLFRAFGRDFPLFSTPLRSPPTLCFMGLDPKPLRSGFAEPFRLSRFVNGRQRPTQSAVHDFPCPGIRPSPPNPPENITFLNLNIKSDPLVLHGTPLAATILLGPVIVPQPPLPLWHH